MVVRLRPVGYRRDESGCLFCGIVGVPYPVLGYRRGESGCLFCGIVGVPYPPAFARGGYGVASPSNGRWLDFTPLKRAYCAPFSG